MAVGGQRGWKERRSPDLTLEHPGLVVALRLNLLLHSCPLGRLLPDRLGVVDPALRNAHLGLLRVGVDLDRVGVSFSWCCRMLSRSVPSPTERMNPSMSALNSTHPSCSAIASCCAAALSAPAARSASIAPCEVSSGEACAWGCGAGASREGWGEARDMVL